MSSSAAPANASSTVGEQLDLALQREAFEKVLTASPLFAVYVWDFILTFPHEYRTMWKSEHWTPVRVAFFINRYGGLLNIIMFMCLFWLKVDAKTCNKVHLLEPVVSSIIFTSGQFILGARLWVVWNRQKWIAWFFGFVAIFGIVIQVWAVAPNKPLSLPSGLRGCISVKGQQNSNYIWVYWIPPLVYDTIATILVLVPLISHWRKSSLTRLLTIFARDGVIYFVVVFICNLINAVYFSIPNVPNPALNAPLTLIFIPMMTSRLVLHLRSAAAPVANSQASGNGFGRPNTMMPTLPAPNQTDEFREQEVHLQNLAGRMRGSLPVSYDGVAVSGLEKRQAEPAKAMSSSEPSASTAETELALALQRAALEEVLSASRTYLTACFAVYVWDFILTFPDDYKAMWRAERWTPVRVAFFIVRYGGLLNLVSFMCLFWLKIDPKTCAKVHTIQPVASIILFLGCEFLLGARVLVMWNRRRWIVWFFGIFAICGTAVQFWGAFPNEPLSLPSGLRGCISVHLGFLVRAYRYWDQINNGKYRFPPLLYDTTVTIFVLVPLFTRWRKSTRTRLLTIFARDGVIYFVVVCICNLVNAVYSSIPNVVNPVLNVPLPLAFAPIMAYRIVLHLRSVAPGANSREGTSGGSNARRGNNLIPGFGSQNQPDTGGDTELRVESLWRKMEAGALPISFEDVGVNEGTNQEKGQEPARDHDEYSSPQDSVEVVSKK
ncbi:hypothetical protein BT69DRAFT_1329750 [Atractiella rhizophila]|nr:hypothetical protein BT69DRAFT_1329750 [Atractiella rhizophila]